MNDIRVSVVVVSRDRPDALRLCLEALRFQFYQSFEIVVVADKAGLKAVQDLPHIALDKLIRCDEANISYARNLGIDHAGGEIVAFIDDDAIAEPTWLEFLVAPFEDPKVGAAGGFVRGRNGISFQWKAESLTEDGLPQDMEVSETTIFHPSQVGVVKTQGTNCAFRRSDTVDLGGFDMGFRFFLDETDLNWRMGQAGICTAIVPDAQVHHRYLGNKQRLGDRSVKSLHMIGQSVAYFRAKHDLSERFISYYRDAQRRRCLEQVVDGRLEPRDVARLMESYDRGSEEPALTQDYPFKNSPAFSKMTQPQGKANSVVLSGWGSQKAALFKKAHALAAVGQAVTVFLFSRTGLYHHRWFHDQNFWVQSGGLFGRSERSESLFRVFRMSERLRNEQQSLEKFRRF